MDAARQRLLEPPRAAQQPDYQPILIKTDNLLRNLGLAYRTELCSGELSVWVELP
jgi:hypothetical protein